MIEPAAPPSHVMKIAVLFQYLLLPTALTTDATHAGPVPLLHDAWSDFAQVGFTQDTCAGLPLLMSVSTVVSGVMTFVHAGP